ncbi:MAG: DMT family transporter [Nitrospirae bacterium]|nr:DMT family transporter [Nitrospirota bacterium]
MNEPMLNPRLILVSVIWGVNFAFVKYALADFSPLSFTVLRFSLASLFLISVMLVNREPFAMERSDISAVFMLGFIGITLYNILFMEGLNFTTASNSALFISSSPLFAALILALKKREPINARIIAGLLLSAGGVFLIIQSKPGGLSFSRRDLAGDLLTLSAAAFWALYTIKARPLLEKYSAIKVTAYSMAAGTVLLLPISGTELLHQSWSSVSIRSWAAFAFSTFVAGGIAFTLWYQGVQTIGVTRTVVYHYIVPFVAVLFAALFLGEMITFLQIIGGMTILAGVYIVQSKNDHM